MTSPATEGLKRQLLRAARGSVLLRIGSLVATMAGSVVLARALGPQGFGVYAFVFAVVSLLALPSQVGIPTLLVRETARTQARAAWPEMRGLWRWATRTIVATSLAVAALALLVVLSPWFGEEPGFRGTLLAGLVLVPLIALGNARGAALRGLRHVVAGQLPESLVRPLLLAVFVGAAWAWGRTVSSADAMWLHVLAGAAAFALGAWLLKRHAPPELATATADLGEAKTWWSAALPLALISGMQVLGSQSGVVLLGFFSDSAEVGLFKVAASAATIALLGLQTANMIIGPYIARLHTTGERDRLQAVASAGALASGALTLPVFLVFLFAGEAVITLLYGARYVDAYWPLVILTGGQVVNALFGSVGQLLNMTGHERDAARWLGIASAIQLGAGLALVPPLGMIGAAIAATLSVVVWNVAFWRLALRKTGVDGSVLSILHLRRRA